MIIEYKVVIIIILLKIFNDNGSGQTAEMKRRK